MGSHAKVPTNNITLRPRMSQGNWQQHPHTRQSWNEIYRKPYSKSIEFGGLFNKSSSLHTSLLTFLRGTVKVFSL